MKNAKQFIGMSNDSLIKRINNSPDFKYDDESFELNRRGVIWEFKNNKAVIIGAKLFN
jgi:hypothetical protein